jgi:ATP-dependent Clp protease adaptor protein ClpS
MPDTLTHPGVEEGIGTSDLGQKIPLFHVVLLDDDEHSYAYVEEMLTTLFMLTKGEAYQKAVEVDSFGRTIVITCELPQAEFGRDQIHAYGADSRMPESKGSMSAVIEPAGAGK